MTNTGGGAEAATAERAAQLTSDYKKVFGSPEGKNVLRDLAQICNEVRLKVRQIRLHWLLHGWLLVHIPLSMALLVLMVVHAVMALYY